MLMSMLALVNRNQSMRSYFEMRIHHITHACIQGKKNTRMIVIAKQTLKKATQNKKYSSKFNLTVQCQREFYILSLQGHKTNPYYIHNTD